MKRNIIKKYDSFLKENVINEDQNPPVNPNEVIDQPGPSRKFSKENKYKFQIKYDKNIVDKLNDYSFTPDEKKKDNFIIIDIQNLSYSFEAVENPDIRTIDTAKLDNIFENL